MTDAAGIPELPESDPRYLAPFLAGMMAARMAIVRYGWTGDVPLAVDGAVQIIDAERVRCVRIIERGQQVPAEAPTATPDQLRTAEERGALAERVKIEREIYAMAEETRRTAWARPTCAAVAAIIEEVGNRIGKMPDTTCSDGHTNCEHAPDGGNHPVAAS